MSKVYRPRVYLYSAQADFAPTLSMSEPEYLGRWPVGSALFLHCGCKRPRFLRLRRSFWIRLVPLLRIYECRACRARVVRFRVQCHERVFPFCAP